MKPNLLSTLLLGLSLMISAASTAFAADSSYSFSVPEASKDTCCNDYDYGNANDNAKIIMGNTNQKLAAVQLAIIETLRLSTGQLSGNSREQTGAQHTLADQQDDRGVVKSIEEQTLKAVNSAVQSPSACRLVSGSPGGDGSAASQTVAAAYNKEMLSWLDGSSDMSSKGQDDAVMKRLEMHCSSFATDADVESGLCETAAKQGMQNADLDPRKSLFANNGPVEALTGDQAKAAQAYIMNTIAPVPFTQLSEEEAKTVEGRMRAQRQKTEMGRIALAAATQHEILARKNSLSTDAKRISWAKGTASNMQGYENADYSNGVSYDDWLKLQSQSYLLNSDELMNSEETEVTALKHIKNMMASLTYQQFENYKVLQNISANLAMQTAILAEGTRTDINFTSAPGKSSAGN
jgi:hypothetical protein